MDSIPRPDTKDPVVNLPANAELFAKATIYDDLTLSTNFDLDTDDDRNYIPAFAFVVYSVLI